jgi:HAMP domain-containing protein
LRCVKKSDILFFIKNIVLGGGLMLYVALLVGVVALFLAWRCSRAVKKLKERDARLSSQFYDLRLEMYRAAEAQILAQLEFEMLRQGGQLQVTGDMTVDQVTALHPQAAAVLATYHIGGCASCTVDGSVRLEEAVGANSGQLEPLLIALNNLVAVDADGTIPKEQLRTPNVQLAI